MKSMFFTLASTALILSLLATRAMAKGGETIGVFALIDRVTLDQGGPSSDTIKIFGVFMVPTPHSSNSWSAPQRGYLYFRVPRGAESDARKEWNQFKTLAGKRQVIGFASWWSPNPNAAGVHYPLEVTVWSETKPPGTPEPYPLAFGVIRRASVDHPDFEEIASELLMYVRLHP